MADAIDRLLRSLEDRFESDLGSEERSAASDLALSLLQDQTLREATPRAGGLLAESPWGQFCVAGIGRDYVVDEQGTTLRRLSDVLLFEMPSSVPPEAIEGSLLDALRTSSRRRPELTVQLRDRCVTGRLERVGRDHVVLRSRERVAIVPATAIHSVSYVPGG